MDKEIEKAVEKNRNHTDVDKIKKELTAEEKKKKWKSMLGKLLVFLILLGISIATSSVNLWDELRDFVLRFVDAATI